MRDLYAFRPPEVNAVARKDQGVRRTTGQPFNRLLHNPDQRVEHLVGTFVQHRVAAVEADHVGVR